MKKLTKNVKKYILTILFGIVWVALLSSVLLLLNPNYKIEESKKYYVKAQTVYHHDYDLSEQYFKNSILLNPDFKKPYLMLFHYYYFVQVQPQKAKIIVEEFINKFPQDSIGYILRSFINIKNGNLIDAEKNLNHSISLMSNNDFNDITFLNQGVLDYYKGEYVNADIMFNKSLFTNNTFMVEETNLYFNSEKVDMILVTLFEFEQYNKSKYLINSILTNGSRYNLFPLEESISITLNQHLSKIYMFEGNILLAEEILLDLERNYQFEKNQGLDCPYQALGILYFKTKDYQKSKGYYMKYADITQFRFSSQYEAAKACFYANDFDCALKYVYVAIELDPDNTDALALLEQIRTVS